MSQPGSTSSGGPPAAAEPELLAALPHSPMPVSLALAAIGKPAAAAVPHLRAAAEDGDIEAGLAVWRTADDPEPLRAAVGQHLDGPGHWADRQRGAGQARRRHHQRRNRRPELAALLPELVWRDEQLRHELLSTAARLTT